MRAHAYFHLSDTPDLFGYTVHLNAKWEHTHQTLVTFDRISQDALMPGVNAAFYLSMSRTEDQYSGS